jgi:uncharacterized RDD family membrane protein YckC
MGLRDGGVFGIMEESEHSDRNDYSLSLSQLTVSWYWFVSRVFGLITGNSEGDGGTPGAKVGKRWWGQRVCANFVRKILMTPSVPRGS